LLHSLQKLLWKENEVGKTITCSFVLISVKFGPRKKRIFLLEILEIKVLRRIFGPEKQEITEKGMIT
jgi:hypothetical protein